MSMKVQGWTHIAIERNGNGAFGEVRFVNDPDPEQIANLWFKEASQIIVVPLEDATQYTKTTTIKEIWE